MITAIVAGNSEGISARLLEEIADSVNLKINTAQGDLINFSSADEAIWIEQANAERFVPLAGCDQVTWTPAQRARLFVRLRALKAL
jgi:hypothetical protein